jgi:hypothetical protein
VSSHDVGAVLEHHLTTGRNEQAASINAFFVFLIGIVIETLQARPRLQRLDNDFI